MGCCITRSQTGDKHPKWWSKNYWGERPSNHHPNRLLPRYRKHRLKNYPESQNPIPKCIYKPKEENSCAEDNHDNNLQKDPNEFLWDSVPNQVISVSEPPDLSREINGPPILNSEEEEVNSKEKREDAKDIIIQKPRKRIKKKKAKKKNEEKQEKSIRFPTSANLNQINIEHNIINSKERTKENKEEEN